MLVEVIEKYNGYGGERPIFPTFVRGTEVKITGAMDKDFAHWFPCEIEGYSTYVPESLVHDGKLAQDYNPTELAQQVGDVLEVVQVVNGWILAKNENGVTGWIAAEAVVTAKEAFDYEAFLTSCWHRDGKCIGEFFHEDALSYLHDSNEILTREDWINHFKINSGDNELESVNGADGWVTTVDRIENLGNDRFMTITFHRSANWNGFVTSIFTVRDGLISQLDEYYSPCDDNVVPQWRGDLKEEEGVYDA